MQVCNIYIIFLIFLFVSCKGLLFSEHPKKALPKALKGVLDLTDKVSSPDLPSKPWDFEKDHTINLDGEWEFYWNELLEPSTVNHSNMRDQQGKPIIDRQKSAIQYINIPGEWNNFRADGKPVGGQGYGTYRLKVLLRKNKAIPSGNPVQLGLKIPDIGTSYKLFLNGKFAAEAGRIGKTEHETKPAYLPQVVSVPDNLEFIEILIQVANFQHTMGGIRNTIILGKLSDLQMLREKNIHLDLFLSGALFMMGIYHFGLFALRRKEKSALYFGFFCLLMALRTLLTKERYWFHLFPDFPWALALKLDFLTFYLGTPVFLQFVHSLFPKEVPKIPRIGILFSSGFLSLGMAVLPVIQITKTVQIMHIVVFITIIICIYTITLAMYRRLTGAKSFFSGFIFFAIITVNDILHANGFIQTGHYSTFGFLIFVFSQSFVLSIRFSRAFSQAEELSANLEKKVHERTMDLLSAKNETEGINRLIKSLNDDLNIKNIMQKVIAYVNENFGIQYYGLYTMNSQKSHIQLLDVSFPDFVNEEDRDIIKKQSIPIQNVIGAYALAVKGKKLFYFRKIRKSGLTKEELFVVEKYKIKSFLTVPLILNNETIGVLGFSNASERMDLSKEDIKKISILGEQLAGIIYGSHLFKEVQAAKIQAEIESGLAFIAQGEAELERGKSEKLLLNILPMEVANELKEKGRVEPVYFENATILFTDFMGFTQIAEDLTPQQLIKELDGCFSEFDQIIERNNLEKLKTIGDSYMCAGGIPKVNSTHPIDSCLAALEIQSFMNNLKKTKQANDVPYWELRLGIHSGSVMAGVIGQKKFVYDVWGDTVNTASRMESSGTPGRTNISHSTYEFIKELFDCEYRGEVAAKNKGLVKMYYLNRIKIDYAKDDKGLVPNEKFWEVYGCMEITRK